ncbi:MAG: MBL fold hydrolase [Gammaproteobacteria bacterium HGW-Gammaproteobacteria-10]|nr:MAG: MBL fold hydrolase [Gammaproteobacteria bacterium HGW-Gammaproteobacteria-10]
MYPKIEHHGAVNGVTGSCHELKIDANNSVLIDCGLFQGAEVSNDRAAFDKLQIEFSVQPVRALIVTHCHIDHVGRIPYLLAAGFDGPIYCSQPSAELLPLVLEDAVQVGFTRDKALVERFIGLIRSKIIAVPYGQWQSVPLSAKTGNQLKVKLKPAGHILGSAYVECDVGIGGQHKRIVFSGDLGGPYTPLLPSPKPPYRADVLVLESTYGDRVHENRRQRKQRLERMIEHCLQNRGAILIPAFSIGRTQELLYELEELIHRYREEAVAKGLAWDDLEIIVDSPLANRFTEVYRKLKPYWDAEAKRKLSAGRHPLAFEQITTIDSHQAHLNTVEYLKKTARPCIVIAASGMCAGGRIVNYLKALIEDERTDILLAGYQAEGTPGRAIQAYGPRKGYVELDGRRYTINAGVYQLSGYSAHADRDSLIRFVKGMRINPSEIRLIHGDVKAKSALQQVLLKVVPDANVLIP